MSTISQVVADEVRRHTRVTFGLMGNGNAYFLDALVREGGRFVPVRHEAAAVAAADTYFRVCDEVACATVTYGAGFTNTLTALAEARKAHTPLVLVVGDQPDSGARPWDVNQEALAAALDIETFHVSKSDARFVTREAFARARSLRVPVVLAIAYDLGLAPAGENDSTSVETIPEPVAPVAPVRIDDDVYLVALEALRGAERPLILAGRGARHAAVALNTLAANIGALTATTAVAKGTFADSRFDLGVCGGFAAEPNAEAIAEADVVLVVGAGLNQFTQAFGNAFDPSANIIQVDITAGPTNSVVTHFLRGDASSVVERLVRDLGQTERREWQMRSLAAVGHAAGSPHAADGKLDPRALTRTLDAIVPANRVVVQDGGHFSGWVPMYWSFPGPARMHMVGTAYQTIGLGLGSAVGATVAAPEATTVLITGDGGLLMALADLDALAKCSTSTIVIVYNDASYGAEVHQYGDRGVELEPMMIGDVDFATLAAGVGSAGYVIRTLDDLTVLSDWVATGTQGMILLDCRISPDVIAPYMHEIVRVTEATENASRASNA